MKKEDFISIIEKLLQATQLKALTWTVNDNGVYTAVVNGCSIVLRSLEDYVINDRYFMITLLNVDDVEFASMSFYELTDKATYNKINDLMECINDRYYRISESKELIEEGLRDLIKGVSLPF